MTIITLCTLSTQAPYTQTYCLRYPLLHPAEYSRANLLLNTRGGNKARQGSMKPVSCGVTNTYRGQLLPMFLSSKGRFKRSKCCFQISKFPKIWKSQGCVLPNYFQNFGCYWGPENLEPLASRFLEPFPTCVTPAHKGDIRVSYAVPQVAFNSRGSLKKFPVVQQYNWSTLKINLILQQQESRTSSNRLGPPYLFYALVPSFKMNKLGSKFLALVFWKFGSKIWRHERSQYLYLFANIPISVLQQKNCNYHFPTQL